MPGRALQLGESIQGPWHLLGKGCLVTLGSLCLEPAGFVPGGVVRLVEGGGRHTPLRCSPPYTCLHQGQEYGAGATSPCWIAALLQHHLGVKRYA